jgi:hypothetical protein
MCLYTIRVEIQINIKDIHLGVPPVFLFLLLFWPDRLAAAFKADFGADQ